MGTFWKCSSEVKTLMSRTDMPEFIFKLCQTQCVDLEKLSHLPELQGMRIRVTPTSFNVRTI